MEHDVNTVRDSWDYSYLTSVQPLKPIGYVYYSVYTAEALYNNAGGALMLQMQQGASNQFPKSSLLRNQGLAGLTRKKLAC